MKKVLLFAVVVAGLGFTSCSKNECECTLSGTTTIYTEEDLQEGQNISDACDDANTNAQVEGGSCKTV
jgi:hypothetical protein